MSADGDKISIILYGVSLTPAVAVNRKSDFKVASQSSTRRFICDCLGAKHGTFAQGVREDARG